MCLYPTARLRNGGPTGVNTHFPHGPSHSFLTFVPGPTRTPTSKHLSSTSTLHRTASIAHRSGHRERRSAHRGNRRLYARHADTESTTHAGRSIRERGRDKMKSLRRSLNNNGASSSSSSSNLPSPPFPGQSYAQGINPLGRPSEKVAPPQKVIKALNSHRSTNPQELSYTKGDFWYVTGEREGWFEALSESCTPYVCGRFALMRRERPVDGLERVGAKGGF
jgi:hypothetical protein